MFSVLKHRPSLMCSEKQEVNHLELDLYALSHLAPSAVVFAALTIG